MGPIVITIVKRSVLMLAVFCCFETARAEQTPLFFVAVTQTTEQFHYRDAELEMAPAPDEYRFSELAPVRVSVRIPVAAGADGRRMAIRAAWYKLLEEKGRRKIIGYDQVTDTTTKQTTHLRFEGVVAAPIRISSFIREKEHISLTLETRFSPIAFPDAWNGLHRKQKWKREWKEWFSVFE